MPKRLIPVRLDPSTLEQLDLIVAASVGERSDHLRKAIDEYIARHNRDVDLDAEHLGVRWLPTTTDDDDRDPYPAVPA